MEDKIKFIPPVPKFSFQKEEAPPNEKKKLDEEMQNFFAELNSSVDQVSKIETQLKPKQIEEPTKKTITVPAKDLSLINSKLSDLLKKRELLSKDQPALPPQVKQSTQQNLKKLGQNEEYDPARPNDYEEYKRKIFEEQKLIKKTSNESPKHENMVIETETKINEVEKMQEEPTKSSAEEKALKMMQKYGFKVGEGLGKNSQGMTTPLIAQKTSDTVGVIKASVLDMTKIIGVDQPLVQTRVLVLLNMVTPSQVDDDLEGEITEELSKYGLIRKCLIFMQPNLEEDIAVRIFVEFENKEDAARAMPFVDGRVFEKRIVVCRYYSEESFAQNIFDNPVQ